LAKSAVIQKVKEMCAAVPGLKSTVVDLGRPEPFPVTLFPLIFLQIDESREERLSCGPDAIVHENYKIYITLVLGEKGTSYKRAAGDAVPFYDRLRAAFAPDPTLGGVCWTSNLSEARTNLRDFRDKQEEPIIGWQLDITEERSASEAAS
jgi:hypothetical protein